MKPQFLFSVNLALVLFFGEAIQMDGSHFLSEATSISSICQKSLEFETPKPTIEPKCDNETKPKERVAKAKVTELDDKVIFEICSKQCGDPIILSNQPCFRRCWIYFHKIRK